MSSRENILAKIKQNQPLWVDLPTLNGLHNDYEDKLSKFKTVLESIGGKVVEVADYEAIKNHITSIYSSQERIITTLKNLADIAETNWQSQDPHQLANVDLAIIEAHFGVAENGSLWVTESLLGQRVTPFICQNLAVVVSKNNFVSTMHEAYKRIGSADYPFGTFIAGPSKTADIEQSLVLGAHGSRTMLVFVV